MKRSKKIKKIRKTRKGGANTTIKRTPKLMKSKKEFMGLSAEDLHKLLFVERLMHVKQLDVELYESHLEKYFDNVSEIVSRNSQGVFNRYIPINIFNEIYKPINIFKKNAIMNKKELQYSLICFCCAYDLNKVEQNKLLNTILTCIFGFVFSHNIKESQEKIFAKFEELRRQMSVQENVRKMLDLIKKIKYDELPTYEKYTEIIDTLVSKSATRFTKSKFNEIFPNKVYGGSEDPEDIVPETIATDSIIPTVDNEDNNICPICMENLTENTFETTTCHHKFHKQCIGGWLHNHRTCPTCRSHIQDSDRNSLQEYIQAPIQAPIVEDPIGPPAREISQNNGEAFRQNLNMVLIPFLYIIPGLSMIGVAGSTSTPLGAAGLAMATICGCFSCVWVPRTIQEGIAYRRNMPVQNSYVPAHPEMFRE